VSDPLHRPGESADTAWTLVNIAEAFPGVVTPLNWTFIHEPSTVAARETFHRIGAFPRSVVGTSERPDDDIWSIFYGRCAANLDTLRELGDRMPGTSGDDMEKQIFGDVRPGVSGKQIPLRYPIVAARIAANFRTLPPAVARCLADTSGWWERTVFGAAPASVDQAADVLREARGHFHRAMQTNSMGAFIGSMMFEQVGALQSAPDAEPLMTGYGDLEEVRIMTDLWAVSRGEVPMETFLRRHGYHGPGEGEISSRSWREQPGPVETLARTYAGMADDRSPAATEARRTRGREAAERELLARTPALKRPAVTLTLKAARRFIPLREVTKGCFVRALDAARWSARHYGALLHGQGRLEHPEDVFYLTYDELLAGAQGELTATVNERRNLREQYRTTTIPEKWIGVPEQIPLPAASSDRVAEKPEPVTREIKGLGVSPGKAVGRACVISDPGRLDELRDGDVLVCELTDPGWTSMFLIASAVVIDTGSPMSHGAVVARELGIPAVVGTGDGSRRIRDGDRLEVDGSNGTVRIL
jgi:pyruvate,water dikinase